MSGKARKAEFMIIVRLAERHGLSLAEFTRLKSLNLKIRARLTSEEADFYRKLAGMANNLNQLAHAANADHLFTTKILEALSNINLVIKKLK